ncbi:ABC transporter substrate-binding protein [Gulosibacter chungangensis]|uniref:ABC transporter substrate-binding protein n=1 Tax=Gulosibacter chungangensis TaxID=979746 RepID=A0A7J5B9N2_9MICO|nr:ABC transporter substrate-binding protein [Gulosibacter chungangensis]KAB1642243.1 ABC transporter substrate-binding protein [Gulosibacter chungangensis]
MSKKTLRTTLVAAAAAAALLLTSCSGAGGTSPTTEGEAAGELTDVTLMLNWYPYGEHAPFYYGVEQGIFEEHGINLNIQAGQGSTKTVQATGQNQVDFGWADTPAVLSNIDKGVGVQSVGVFLQTTPSAVQVFADSGITEPADLVGKTIATSAGDAPTTTFPLYLEAAGLNPDDVIQQNLDAAGKMAAMMNGQVDGLIGFAHDQGPTIANESGNEVVYLKYSDVGLNFFSNGLIASNQMISDNPELVQAMVDATSESFEAAVADPEAAVAAMDGKDPQMPVSEVLLEQWTATAELLSSPTAGDVVPGTNSTEDWEATIEVLAEAGLIEEAKPVDTYFNASFAPAGGTE